MKKLFLLTSTCILILTCCKQPSDANYISAEGKTYSSYTDYTEEQVNALKKPIVLVGKSQFFGLWGVTLQDSTGKIITLGDLSSLANHIGNSRSVGDTIIK